MFNQLLNEIAHKLSQDFTTEQIRMIADTITVTMHGYTLQKECTDVAVYSGGVPKLVQYYILDIASQNYSQGTIKNIKLRLNRFFEWVRKDPEQVKPNDIKAYTLMHNQVYEPVKDCTLEKHRQTICSFFKWAYDEDYLPEDITRRSKAMKYEKTNRTSLSKDQLEYLRQACEDVEEKAFIEVLYSTGMRIGEACAVKLKDVDFSKRVINVYGEKTRKWREVYLSPCATIYLNNYIQSRRYESEYLFCSRRSGKRVSPPAATAWLTSISDRCYEHTHTKVTPHIMRHTFATHAVHNGMPIEVVSKILGHANIQTTMVYIDLDHSSIQDMHSKYIA